MGRWGRRVRRPLIMEDEQMGVNDRKQDEKEAQRAKRGGLVGQAEWRGYINVNLSPDEKAQFDEWMRGDDPWEVLQEVVQSGCVVTVKLNAGNSSGCLASITQRSVGSLNAGLCVTARASSAGKALFRAVFLVASLGVESDWAAVHPTVEDDRW